MRADLPFALGVLLLLAGCSTPPASDGAGPSASFAATSSGNVAAVAQPAPVTVTVPFSWSGHTKEGVWACGDQSGAGACMAGQQVAPDGQFVTLVGYAGNLTAVQLTMEWQADPGVVGLVLAVFGNTTQGLQPLGLVHGTSPLAMQLDLTGAGLVRDGSLMLMVWPKGKTATSPSVFVDATQQDFTVDGTLTAG